MNDLKLYYSTTCPYCRFVLQYIEENNVSVNLINVRESSDALSELRTIAGKTQVPCLVIDGKPMHESRDIVDWLKENVS